MGFVKVKERFPFITVEALDDRLTEADILFALELGLDTLREVLDGADFQWWGLREEDWELGETGCLGWRW